MESIFLKSTFLISASALVLIGCNGGGGNETAPAAPAPTSIKDMTLLNETAYIPPQCYTDTIDVNQDVHNPCFACHHPSKAPNFIEDGEIQFNYIFPVRAINNPWSNLFVDRSSEVAAISDEEILNYVRESNYFDTQGNIALAEQLNNIPEEWDVNGNGKWDGYTPDCYYNFDSEGFDIKPDGEPSGWRAFAYYPFLGTFWPTNGATNDVLIRMPSAFRNDVDGRYNKEIYKINLAILESVIKQQDVEIASVDENLYGLDLDKNGSIGTTNLIKFTSIHTAGLSDSQRMQWAGQAGAMYSLNHENKPTDGLYPIGTEFLHTVRYLDYNDQGSTLMANRMKEVRYGVKYDFFTTSSLKFAADEEADEKDFDPNLIKTVRGNPETGADNGFGWRFQGFIEEANGALRPQTWEETVFCIGCHSTIGAVADNTFVFQRKFGYQSFQNGWHHWTQKSIAGTPDPIRQSDGLAEYTHYLQQNGAGDEFRGNEEVIKKFFDANGNLIPEQAAALQSDVSELLFPSPERALTLNKAYKVIVEEQTFEQGRDATVTPVTNVHREVEHNEATGITSVVAGPYIPAN